MRALSTAELTRLRTVANTALPDSCTISRATIASDNAGGQTQSWATVATVACRLAPRLARPLESETSDRMQNATDWIITVPRGTDVRTDDRIVVGSRTFEVTKNLVRSYQTAQQVLASEVV
jgi:head-tail adaptor